MKKHFVRTSQTDRYALPVPETAADLGSGFGEGQTDVESYSSGDSPELTLTSITVRGLSDSGNGGIKVPSAGLFLIIVTAFWTFDNFGAPSTPRTVGFSVNGGSFANSLDLNNDSTGTATWADQGTWLHRLQANDVVKPRVFSDPGFGWEVYAKIQIAQLSS